MIAVDKKIPIPITNETLGNKEFDMKLWGALVILYSNYINDGEMIIIYLLLYLKLRGGLRITFD